MKTTFSPPEEGRGNEIKTHWKHLDLSKSLNCRDAPVTQSVEWQAVNLQVVRSIRTGSVFFNRPVPIEKIR